MGPTLVDGHGNQVYVHLDLDPRAALQTVRDVLGLARRLGLRNNLALLLSRATNCSARTGHWPWAREEVDAAGGVAMSPTRPRQRAVRASTVQAIRHGESPPAW
jgi:hypothetical protein